MAKSSKPYGLEFHPLACILPLMNSRSKELAGVIESIKTEGVKEEVILFEGKILDGRNRLQIAEEAGIPWDQIPRREFNPKKDGDPVTFVKIHNLARRQLTADQVAFAAAEFAKILAKELKDKASDQSAPPKSKKNKDGKSDPKPSHAAREKAAEEMGTSVDAIKKASHVANHPELKDKVEAGEISLNAAASEASRIDSAKKANKPVTDGDKDKRKKLVEAVIAKLGAESKFGESVKRGSQLKDLKELKNFSELEATTMKEIIPLLIQGVTLKGSIKVLSTKPTWETTLGDAANWAVVQGAGVSKAEVVIELDGYTITVTPTKEQAEVLRAI